jgi:nitrate/nitrite transporter NarK
MAAGVGPLPPAPPRDGLSPVVLFFITAAVSAETGSGGSAPVVEAIVDLATGAVAGAIAAWWRQPDPSSAGPA